MIEMHTQQRKMTMKNFLLDFKKQERYIRADISRFGKGSLLSIEYMKISGDFK